MELKDSLRQRTVAPVPEKPSEWTEYGMTSCIQLGVQSGPETSTRVISMPASCPTFLSRVGVDDPAFRGASQARVGDARQDGYGRPLSTALTIGGGSS